MDKYKVKRLKEHDRTQMEAIVSAAVPLIKKVVKPYSFEDFGLELPILKMYYDQNLKDDIPEARKVSALRNAAYIGYRWYSANISKDTKELESRVGLAADILQKVIFENNLEELFENGYIDTDKDTVVQLLHDTVLGITEASKLVFPTSEQY